MWAVRLALCAACAAALVGLTGCGGGNSNSSDAGTDAGAPPPTDAGNACTFSYQCPDGTYCDLQQCTQACNAQQPCPDGLACTPRGRCSASASDPGDPPIGSATGKLTSDVQNVLLKSSDQGFKLTLKGTGNVRFRLDSSAGWVVPPYSRGTFTGSVTIPFTAMPSAAPADAPSAVVRVFSDQGDLDVLVATKPALQDVWAGNVVFTSVNVGGSTGVVPLPLGSAHLGVAIRTDAPGPRVQINPTASTFWAAGAAGPATGAGVANPDGTTTFTIDEILDGTSAASLYTESPSVFGTRTIGRQLELVVSVGDDGSLSGTMAETIYGLTSTPVEIDGTVTMNRDGQATLPTFGLPTPVTMPAGPTRGTGPAPMGCPGTSIPACTGGTTTDDKWTCITGSGTQGSGLLEVGFPLDTFYLSGAATQVPGTFAVPTSADAGAGPSPYTTSAQGCAADLGGGNWRIPSAISAPTNGCASTGAIDCARYQAGATLVGVNDSLASQAAQDAARAYLELFALIGNQDAVTAVNDRLGTNATSAQLEKDHLAARAAFDDGLSYVFDPRLFEELRATTASDAQVGPLPLKNDRVALRRAAEALSRSATETGDALDVDLASTSDATTLRAGAQADATLYWVETALLADLEARWRAGADPLPEVVGLGDVVTRYDAKIQDMTADANPLGISKTYVPLLANGPNGPGGQTNFERLDAVATASVMNSVNADATAAAEARAYDQQVAAAQTELAKRQTAYLSTITGICGDSFVVNGVPDTDMNQCGAATGTAAAAINAVQTAKLQLLQANEALQAQLQLYEAQTDAYAQIHQVNADLVELITASNQKIFDLSIAQASAKAAADIASAMADAIDSMLSKFPPVFAEGALKLLAGVLNAAADMMQPFIDQQHDIQQLAQVSAGAQVTDIQNELSLKQTAIQFAGLRTQVAIAANQVAGAVSNLETLLEQVGDAEAGLRASAQMAGRNIATDPSFRVVQSASAVAADAELLQAKHDLYLAARALEYETNTPMPAITTAIFAAGSAAELSSLSTCLSNAWTQWRLLVSSTNRYVTEVSLAKDVLGITGPVVDPQTQETLSPGQQFRRYLFSQPYSPDLTHIWPALSFGTTLDDKGSLFSALLCNDRIEGIEAKLVGTGLTGTTGEIQVLANGASTMRSCAQSSSGTQPISVWNLRPAGSPAPAIIESGINAYPSGVMPNQSLYDYAVAQSQWIVAIPDASTSPANAGLDVTAVDDIVLRITHTGVAVGSATSSFNPTCN